jgi:hypothetical protein
MGGSPDEVVQESLEAEEAELPCGVIDCGDSMSQKSL